MFSPYPFRCSGYQGDDTRHEIHQLLRWPEAREGLSKETRIYTDMRPWFKLYKKIGCWYLSHAGIHPNFVMKGYSEKSPKEQLDDWLMREIPNATANMFAGLRHPVLGAGHTRGGDQQYGGIVWMDWSELTPIPGVNQLVGHTCCPNMVRSKITADSHNYCIDTDCCHFAIIDDESTDPKDIIIRQWMSEPRQGKRIRGFS